MTKTILILGGGFAGIPAAHYILKHQAAKLDLKVVLVSQSEDFYWAVATPRVVIPGQMGEEKVLYNIPKQFEQHPSSRFEFVLGTARRWDPDQNSLTVTNNDGSSRTLSYHTIIVATGSHAKDQMPWKLVGGSAETRAVLAKVREDVRNADSIVVGGAGPTGVELAGELGSEYAKAGRKRVTIVTSADQVLEERVMGAVRQTARRELERMNIRVVTGTRITSVADAGDAAGGGATLLQLQKSDGSTETLRTDLFVPTWGMGFNSDFAPAGMRQPNGRLRVTKSMQAPGYKNAFIVGDVADRFPQQVVYAEHAVKHVLTALEAYLAGGAVPDLEIDEAKLGHVVSLGRDRAAGHMGSWKLPGWLLWWFKSRTLGTNYAPAIAKGKRFVILGSI